MDIFQKFETILPKPLGLAISTDPSKLSIPQCYGKREDIGLTGYTSCLNLSLTTSGATASSLQHDEQAGWVRVTHDLPAVLRSNRLLIFIDRNHPIIKNPNGHSFARFGSLPCQLLQND